MARRVRPTPTSRLARNGSHSAAPTPARPTPSRPTPRAIALVFGLALAVRAVHLCSLSSSPLWTATMGDAVSYLDWARRIAAGNWLGTEAFYQAPLYPYVVAAIFTLPAA